MSLMVDPKQITGVLLVDGWHKVKGKSFAVEAGEAPPDAAKPPAKRSRVTKPPANALAWPAGPAAYWDERDDRTVICPLSSILALRQSRAK